MLLTDGLVEERANDLDARLAELTARDEEVVQQRVAVVGDVEDHDFVLIDGARAER